MAITEQSRKQLYDGLEEVLGEERATTLMEHLPPVGWADVATKQDLDHLRVVTTKDIDALRVSTTRDIDALRVSTTRDIDALRVATTRDIEKLRSETTRDIEQLRGETTVEFANVRGEVEYVRSALSTELAHFREVTELRFNRIEDRLDHMCETFATKRELALLRGDMYKLVTAQTLVLVFAMFTIASRVS